jgi:hypothetical protein
LLEKIMHVNKLILIALAAVILLGVLTTVWASRRTEAVFNGTIAITFTQTTDPTPKITVTDPAEVRRFIGTLHLTPATGPSGKRSLHAAIFEKPTGRVEVSFDSTRFYVHGAKALDIPAVEWGYSTPKEFCLEFHKLTVNQTNANWIEP